MSQETWEIVQDKNIDGMELQLALQCAPLIAGLKISNLLNISKEDFRKMKEIIKGSHISWCLWMETEYKMTILLYHRQSLKDYLGQERVLEMFRELGYQRFCVDGILEEFRIRYERYMREKGDFPHEMGLLLGYPAGDVEGFWYSFMLIFNAAYAAEREEKWIRFRLCSGHRAEIHRQWQKPLERALKKPERKQM